METNSYKMISLPEVRDRIKLRLKQFSTTINDDAIDLFIMDANRDIMSSKKVEPKVAPLEIEDYSAPLPCDYDSFMALVTCPCGEFNQPLIYSNFSYEGENCRFQTWDNTFKIVGGYIKFPTNIEFDSVSLYYNANITDENGFPLLPDSHVLYYSDYATSRFFEMEGDVKMADYIGRKAKNRRRALVHNEKQTEWELDKLAFKATIYSLVNAYNYNNGFGLNNALLP